MTEKREKEETKENNLKSDSKSVCKQAVSKMLLTYCAVDNARQGLLACGVLIIFAELTHEYICLY